MPTNWQKLDDSDPNTMSVLPGDILGRGESFFLISTGGDPAPQHNAMAMKRKESHYWTIPKTTSFPKTSLSTWRNYFGDPRLQVWRDLAAPPVIDAVPAPVPVQDNSPVESPLSAPLPSDVLKVTNPIITLQEGDIVTEDPWSESMLIDQPNAGLFWDKKSSYFTAHSGGPGINAWGTPGNRNSLGKMRARYNKPGLIIYRKCNFPAPDHSTASPEPTAPKAVGHNWVCLNHTVSADSIVLQPRDVLSRLDFYLPPEASIAPQQDYTAFYINRSKNYCTISDSPTDTSTLAEVMRRVKQDDILLWRDTNKGSPAIQPSGRYQWTKLADATEEDRKQPLKHGDVICRANSVWSVGYPIPIIYENGLKNYINKQCSYFIFDSDKWSSRPTIGVIRALSQDPTVVVYRDMCLSTRRRPSGQSDDELANQTPISVRPYQWTRIDNDPLIEDPDKLCLFAGDIICHHTTLPVSPNMGPDYSAGFAAFNQQAMPYIVLKSNATLGYMRKIVHNRDKITAWRDLSGRATNELYYSQSLDTIRNTGYLYSSPSRWNGFDLDSPPNLRPKGMDRCKGNQIYSTPLPLP